MSPRSTGATAHVDLDHESDLEGALDDWRRYRRRRRLVDTHWVDALYRAYLAALISGAAVLLAVSAVGDDAVTVTDDLRDSGHLAGIGVAVLIAVGLRSGSRGGPLALERADVRHVLLAPVDRTTALRGPAVRQLRFLLFVAAVVGVVAGLLADRRLPGGAVAWAASGALCGIVAVALSHGCAMLAGGLRLRSWAASLVGLGLVGWSIADAAGRVRYSPGSLVGQIALWPVHFEAPDLAAVALAPVVVYAGLRSIGGLSLEGLERRSRLVGQLRFAATLQDLRTVVVLRRQLAQERPRNHPWLRPRLPRRSLPVLVRDIRSLLRWPAGRVARLAILAAVAGAAGRGAWEGTTPLVLVAGIALFLVGLDAAEPLGQELDHPTRRDTVPEAAGWVHLRHLPVVFAVSTGVALLAAAVAVLVDPVPGAWPVALACVVPAGLGAAAGATVNLLMGSPGAATATSAWNLAPPEAAGMRIVFRTAFPPALAITGCAGILIARAAFERGDDPTAGALAMLPPMVGIVVLVAGWVRVRDDIKAWWALQTEAMQPSKTSES
jgi:hypothetical protein